MQPLDRDSLTALLKANRIKPRIIRELRFRPEDVKDWNNHEILSIPTRSGNEGILLIQSKAFYILPYELTLGLKDKTTGRSKPITCDFCFTWQQGGKAGLITFRKGSDNHSFTYLCCADLRCSLHVRDLSAEATLSRTQLREDIDQDRRIVRLDEKLSKLVMTLDLSPAII